MSSRIRTRITTRDLYNVDGRDIWTYCETCCEAPQKIAAELATTSAQGIDPAVTVAAFVVTCSGCNRSQRFSPGVTGSPE